MAETASAVASELRGLDKKQLKVLESMHDKQLLANTVSNISKNGTDLLIKVAENEMAQYVAAFVAVRILNRTKVIDDITAGLLQAAIIAKAGWDTFWPW